MQQLTSAHLSCASYAVGILDLTILKSSCGSKQWIPLPCLHHKTAKRHQWEDGVRGLSKLWSAVHLGRTYLLPVGGLMSDRRDVSLSKNTSLLNPGDLRFFSQRLPPWFNASHSQKMCTFPGGSGGDLSRSHVSFIGPWDCICQSFPGREATLKDG